MSFGYLFQSISSPIVSHNIYEKQSMVYINTKEFNKNEYDYKKIEYIPILENQQAYN